MRVTIGSYNSAGVFIEEPATINKLITESKVFVYDIFIAAVADNATEEIEIVTTNEDTAFSVNVAVNGKHQVVIRENPNGIGGTLVTGINLDRRPTSETPSASVRESLTLLDTNGSTILRDVIIDTGTKKDTAFSSESTQIILNRNTKYSVEVTNLSGATDSLQLIVKIANI